MDGYDGDGKNEGTGCFDVNECQLDSHECHDIATCENLEGSYDCQCPIGYQGDGFVSSSGCLDIDECNSDVNTCHLMASCSNTEGSFNCECLDDWLGNGFSCAQDICSICDPDASCDGQACNCPAGYAGSGFFCPKNSLVVPIKTKPEIMAHSKTCVDAYWTQIASNAENCVILESPKSNWAPCLEFLSTAGVEIFISLDTSPISIELIKVSISILLNLNY